jgi:hypothetical protein
MTKWTVLLEFRHDVPAFELVVEADTKNRAILIAEEAAVRAGWADAELRTIKAWPLINWVKKEVA